MKISLISIAFLVFPCADASKLFNGSCSSTYALLDALSDSSTICPTLSKIMGFCNEGPPGPPDGAGLPGPAAPAPAEGAIVSVAASTCEEVCEKASSAYDQLCWRRRLGEIEAIPPHRALQVVKEKKGDINGIVISQEDVLPEEACDSLKGHLDYLYEAENFDLENVHHDYRNLPREEIYSTQIGGAELIEIIGKDNARSLLDYYHKALGMELPVTKIGLQLARNGLEEKQHFTHHKDHKATLLVFLTNNDESFEGGHLNYLTAEGQQNFDVKKGKAVAHGPDTIHGATMWSGDRYVVSFKSNGLLWSDCILKEHLE